MNFITTFVLDSVLCEDHKPGKLHARVIMTVQLHCVMSCMRVCRKQALSRVKYYYY